MPVKFRNPWRTMLEDKVRSQPFFATCLTFGLSGAFIGGSG